ncbi:M23 family metallopeptidase, partial [Ilumatobacter sp.]|uniref:M23 family metallopeptidase n=1 Tax=Ilumatobacter sp. TaxID=1967498 RepID=UPI003C4C88CA
GDTDAEVIADEATDSTDDVAGSDESTDPAPKAADPNLALFDVCPVAGPSTFEDSWGWARSGGRSHEGVDMIADRGTPIRAVRDGDAQFKTNGLGGRAIWLTTANGDKFYYAHLDDWEGESRAVQAGDVIGYVGSTGNAQGPHLHFETLPGGSVENPYAHTFGACIPSPAEFAAARNSLNDPDVWSRFIPEA